MRSEFRCTRARLGVLLRGWKDNKHKMFHYTFPITLEIHNLKEVCRCLVPLPLVSMHHAAAAAAAVLFQRQPTCRIDF